MGHAGPRVRGEELAGVRLHEDQRVPAGDGEPVEVVGGRPAGLHEVAGDRDLAYRAAPQRHGEDLGGARVGEEGLAMADGNVVDERRASREGVLGDVGAGARVVDEGLAGRPAGHPQLLVVDLEPDGRAPLVGGHERGALAGAHVAAVDGAGGDRADVEALVLDVDALWLPSVGQRDELREGRVPGRVGGRGGRGEQQRRRGGEQGKASHDPSPTHRRSLRHPSSSRTSGAPSPGAPGLIAPSSAPDASGRTRARPRGGPRTGSSPRAAR
jgi:hypothetical protein